MSKRSNINNHPILMFLLVCLFAGSAAYGQGSAFTYQGKLTEAGNPATGTYDMLFKLFNTPTVGTGTQQGSTIDNPSVQVSAGIFTVQLDFGANVFGGAARYLEIAVRPAGNPNPHTILSPRQPITSSPYAIQTLNAQQLGGLPASRFVQFDANGNVGIGVPDPNAKLTVATSSGEGIIVRTFQPGGTSIVGISSAASGSGTGVYGQAVSPDGYAGFFAGRVYVTSNVGIGTANIAARLSVSTSTINAGNNTALTFFSSMPSRNSNNRSKHRKI